MEESYLETAQQADQLLSVSAVRDALPEQTAHCPICQQPLYHINSCGITHTHGITFKFVKSQKHLIILIISDNIQ